MEAPKEYTLRTSTADLEGILRALGFLRNETADQQLYQQLNDTLSHLAEQANVQAKGTVEW